MSLSVLQVAFENRAATVLFNIARSNCAKEGVWLLPANVCPVVPLAFLAAGKKIEFIDVDAVNLCISESAVIERLAENGTAFVEGIVYVRTYGTVLDVSGFFAQVKSVSPESLIIDDLCLTFPEFDLADTSTQSDACLYSTGYGKCVDLGFGGYALLRDGVSYHSNYHGNAGTSRKKFEELDTQIKTHIASGKALATDASITNAAWLDCSEPTAPWGEYQKQALEALDMLKSTKKKNNEFLLGAIANELVNSDVSHDWRLQLNVANKEQLLEAIFSAGAFASGHYYPASQLFGGAICEMAEAAHRSIVNIFNDQNVDQKYLDTVVEVVNSVAEPI